MAWYDDKKKTVYVATYKNEKDMRKEVEAASKKGWVPQGTAATDGHVNVGRTTLRVMTGVGLMFGASRTKGNLTITFIRDPSATQG